MLVTEAPGYKNDHHLRTTYPNGFLQLQFFFDNFAIQEFYVLKIIYILFYTDLISSIFFKHSNILPEILTIDASHQISYLYSKIFRIHSGSINSTTQWSTSCNHETVYRSGEAQAQTLKRHGSATRRKPSKLLHRCLSSSTKGASTNRDSPTQNARTK